MQTFTIKAEARRADGQLVKWAGKVKASDHYAANDRALEHLRARGAEFYPVVRMGERKQRRASPELALTLSTEHAEESN